MAQVSPQFKFDAKYRSAIAPLSYCENCRKQTSFLPIYTALQVARVSRSTLYYWMGQLVDSCGRDITTGNYLAVEHRNPFTMNPNNQSVVNINTSIVNGRWVDWMTYLYTQSPGVPSGWFLKVNQTIHVVNQSTGRDDPVATYCQYYDPYNVYHYSGACT